MKKLLTILTILVGFSLVSVSARAQSGGGTESAMAGLTAGDISTACYSTKNGVGNNPWNTSLVVNILKVAKDTPVFASRNYSLGQFLQVYHSCNASITFMGTFEGIGQFRVSAGGEYVVIFTTTF